jgi:NDP-sugar pyrophosphorylase family protein
LKVVITMAGLGMRFKNAGYHEEKHAIIFNGKTLFEWAIESLENFKNYEFIFVTRDLPNIDEFIIEKTEKLGFRKIQVEKIKHPTRGQAETVAFAKKFFKKDESLMIFNSDTHVNPDMLRPEKIKGNGWIPVFSANGNQWSFVKASQGGFALQVAEKTRISDNCSIGLYYFDSFRKFEKLLLGLRTGSTAEKEWYIAPLYNEFIRLGNKVRIYKIPKKYVMVLGTPEDLANANERLHSNTVLT